MGNGYKAFCGGSPEYVIPITLSSGETVYHGVSEWVARNRPKLSDEIIPGFWRRKK